MAIPLSQRIIAVLWPSFLMAGVATVVFFAVMNYVKIAPYAWLGQFDETNLMTALVLSPLAPIGMGLGIWLHNRVTDRFFFRVAYAMLFVVGLKLIWDGIAVS